MKATRVLTFFLHRTTARLIWQLLNIASLWANGPRDGQFYALTVNTSVSSGNISTSLVLGKLSGGAPKSFAGGSAGEGVTMVGWTTD